MSDATTTPADSPADAASNASKDHPFRYDARLADEIEDRWQRHWEENDTFATPNPGDAGFDPGRPKFYCLDMFPYPSGAGLHVGHPEGYTATDILCRYKRMTGCNVLHPMGWDAFGLPAEQYAIQTGVHPSITTRQAIDNFRRQLKRFGFSYDWSREIATIDEDYYRWTQWIWLKAYDAWFDPATNRARPISELLQDLENGNAYVGPSGELVQPGLEGKTEVLGGEPVGLQKWHELAQEDRRRLIDSQRLAYIDHQNVNWCPKLGTALANEEVIDGRSEVGGYPVLKKPLKQWMFRITAFAERLLADLESLDWPESTRTMQQAWIGRSEGAEIDFPIIDPPEESDLDPDLRVFTTRPDTVFGATYMVLAPEHPLVTEIIAHPRVETDVDALRDYVEASSKRSDVDRMVELKEKTGVFTGAFATNPANNQRIQIWTADYVLMGYGTGAIMAVPGQDQRDWDFAKAFDLPIVRTVQPPDDFEGEAYLGDGPAINSGFLDGYYIAEAKTHIIDWLEENDIGTRKINYKLRDWLFSRQRYWGEPFPVVFDENGDHYPIDESNLPVVLPEMEDFKPAESDDPQPLLGKATHWVNTTAGEAGVSPDVLPPETPVRRETNTMPQWAGSCWYYLRYCDPKNNDRFVSRDIERYWLLTPKGDAENAGDDFSPDHHHIAGIDQYIGGAEHAVLHLLYARFWHRILYDLGEVSTPEPFGKLFHQGLIQSFAYQRSDKSLVAIDAVEEREDGSFVESETGETVTQVMAKMSKSLKNIVNPDDVIAKYGADTFRLYGMYMGPLESAKPWNPRDIVGVFRFLQRVWRLAIDETTGDMRLAESPDTTIERQLHRTIAKVGSDIERLAFNTAIAAMIEFVNAATSGDGLTANQLERFVLTLAPFAPHIAEELWFRLGQSTPLAYEPWPEFDESMMVEDEIELPVQIQGKVRGRIRVPAHADDGSIEAAALAEPAIAAHLKGKEVRKVIVVPGKIVNIITG